ncbi:MAG: DUF4810 domain-containing protein [Burkholderiales bacterium PBB5]|jgi:hypothetical protein|nr:MAG: DUF4810 domain-containing protein [Burkholderiales bacterium PBB5]
MSRSRRLGLGLALTVVVLAGCAQRGPAPLYLWESFPRQQYDLLLRDGISPADQIQALEAHAEKARAAQAALPPGLRAHLGLLYLNAGNAGQARALWTAERQAFPESAPYIDQMLKRLDGQAKPTSSENPA